MKAKQPLLALLLAGALLPLLTTGPAWAGQRPPETPALLAHGETVYRRHCAACHGAEGDGAGPGAYILSQRPRNLQLGVFKFRSTPSGQNPTDQDLFKTITRGLSGATGAMMPSFRALPERDRWALVAVVKNFAGIERPGTAIEVPREPAADLALGAAVYERLQCASCHGAEGLGDGPSSITLKDDQKRRTWAPNLVLGRHKGGAEPAEIYTRIVTGLDGSPMPAYAGKATPKEIWALTHYLLSLPERQAKAASQAN